MTSTNQTFEIVFKKLGEAASSNEPSVALVFPELDEVDELRRLSMEMSEPEPTYHTST